MSRAFQILEFSASKDLFLWLRTAQTCNVTVTVMCILEISIHHIWWIYLCYVFGFYVRAALIHALVNAVFTSFVHLRDCCIHYFCCCCFHVCENAPISFSDTALTSFVHFWYYCTASLLYVVNSFGTFRLEIWLVAW